MENFFGSMELSSDVLERSGIGLWAFEFDNNSPPRMYVNESMLAFLGLKIRTTPEDIYKIWYDNIDHSVRSVFEKNLKKISEGGCVDLQFTWHNAKRGIIYARFCGKKNPKYTKGLRLEGCYQDITEMTLLRQTEEELDAVKKQKALNDSIFTILDNMPALAFMKDAETGKIIYCNEAFVRFSRKKDKSEIIGKTDFDLYDKEIAEKFVNDDKKALAQDATHVVYDDNTLDEYGNPMNLQTTKMKFVDSQNRTCLLGMSVNVTELLRIRSELEQVKLKHIEEELELAKKEKRSSDNLKAILEAIPALTYVNFVETGKIIYCNRAYAHFIGKESPDDLIGKTNTEVFGKELAEKFEQENLKIFNSDSPYLVFDEIFSDKNGVMRNFQSTKLKFIDSDGNECVLGISVDITEIVKNKIELENIEQRHHDMLRMMRLAEDFDIIYDVNVETGAFTQILNPGIFSGKYWIKQADEENFFAVVDKNINLFIYQEDRQKMLRLMSRENIFNQLSTKSGFSAEYRFGRKLFRWYKIKIVRYGDWEKEKRAVIGFYNIDALRKQEEEKKFYSEISSALSTTFESLYYIDLESSKYSFYHVDKESVIFNKVSEGEDFFSMAKERMFSQLIKDGREMSIAFFEKKDILRNIAPGQIVTKEYRMRINGNEQWHRTKFTRLKTNPNHFIVAVENINEEIAKRSEYALQLEVERSNVAILARALTQIYLLCVRIELDKNHYTVLKYSWGVNRNVEEGDYDELVKRHVFIINDPEQYELYKQTFSRQALMDAYHSDKQGDIVKRFHYTSSKDGLVHHLEIRAMFLDPVFSEYTVFICARNIDGEIHNQLQLAEALSVAQAANRAKTTFLNSMSHDIRTPMNAIIGFTGLAASHIKNIDQVKSYLSKIAQSSEHLLSLINDVLDMSRIESGKMNLSEKEENFSEIIHSVRDIILPALRAKQQDFFIDTLDVIHETVFCDRLRLNQLLINTITNAVKYTQAGGNITLRIIEKKLNRPEYASFEFYIKDNGIGMSQEFLKTIFDPFTRVKSSTVSGIQGTGLGMAITKNIVDMMGGTINITSEEKVGTEVIINLNFRIEERTPKAFTIDKLKGIRGLVVDDDLNSCSSVSKMLRDIGMRSEWCASGKEAVFRTEESLAIGDVYGVYIIDWQMPDMNGIETVRRIRRIVGEDASIIILTAYDWADIEEEAREAGVTEFLCKPLFISELYSALNSCCGIIVEDQKDKTDEDNFEGKRILLVEDNELNREIAQELLQDAGFIIDTAEDGTIAVKKVKESPVGTYNLILMDIQMPIMDGYEATRQIRAIDNKDLANIPILAMTANAFEEDRQAALQAGMNEHIAKPINAGKLFAMLKQFIG